MSGERNLTFCELAAFLEDQPEPLAEIVIELRKLVLAAAPDAVETIAWGGLSYHRPDRGGRIKGAVCQISLHRSHVRLSFIHGVRLPDPSRLLRGDRKSKRFVPLKVLGEVGALPLVPLIRAAAGQPADRHRA